MPIENSHFGISVALDDERLVIGTNEGDIRPTTGFPLHMYSQATGAWQYAGTLDVPEFATFVATSKNRVVAANPFSAAVYAFDEFGELSILDGPRIEQCERFGSPVAIDEDLIVAGKGFCQQAQASFPMEVVLYRHIDYQWIEEARLLPPADYGGGIFGAAVGVSGNRVAVSAPNLRSSSIYRSTIHIFEREGGVWVHKAVLRPSTAVEPTAFGRSLHIDGDVVIGGATLASSAWIFRNTESGWVEEARLRATSSLGAGRFGWSVSISGNTAIVGDTSVAGGSMLRGYSTVFRKVLGEWVDIGIQRSISPEPEFGLGSSVDTNGSVAVIGVPGTSAGEYGAAGSVIFLGLPRDDCNDNGVFDRCDLAVGTSTDCDGNLVPDECRLSVSADIDADGAADLLDFSLLQGCFGEKSLGGEPLECRTADLVPNCLINLDDFAEFRILMTGPGGE